MKSKKKFFLIILLVILCIFLLINVIWLFYIQFVFTPLTSNFDNRYSVFNYVADLVKRDDVSISDSTYILKNDPEIDEKTCYYVAYPNYLKFSGKYETQLYFKDNSKFYSAAYTVHINFLNTENIEFCVTVPQTENSYFDVKYDLNSDGGYDEFHSPEQLSSDEADKLFYESQEQLELLKKLSSTMFD